MTDHEDRSLHKESQRVASMSDRDLLRAALDLMVVFVNGVPPAGRDRDWALLRAGLWTGEVLRRAQADDPGPGRSALSQAITTAQQEELEKVKARVQALEVAQQSRVRAKGTLTPEHHVAALDLSPRARQTLDRLMITSVGQILSRTESELLAKKNFGQTTLNEIRNRLAVHGLTLAAERAP